MNRTFNSLIIRLIVLSLFLFACQPKPEPTPSAVSPTATATVAPPTQTTQPMAVLVNGEGIPLAEYQAELQRYQAALGTELATNQKEQVINDLIDQLLLAQAAKKEGFVVENPMVEERIKQLSDQMGSEQALQAWMEQFYYSKEDLKDALSRQIAAAWKRDKIFSQTPKTAEQVHARQILLYQ
ncbi:MAG: SurA N-terminal domain-containing protein, partial [Anaerolineales bacterium]